MYRYECGFHSLNSLRRATEDIKLLFSWAEKLNKQIELYVPIILLSGAFIYIDREYLHLFLRYINSSFFVFIVSEKIFHIMDFYTEVLMLIW